MGALGGGPGTDIGFGRRPVPRARNRRPICRKCLSKDSASGPVAMDAVPVRAVTPNFADAVPALASPAEDPGPGIEICKLAHRGYMCTIPAAQRRLPSLHSPR